MTDERRQGADEEMVNLNAPELDAGQLDDPALEEVSGGGCGVDSCTMFSDH